MIRLATVRDEEDVEVKDPLERLQKWMLNEGWLTKHITSQHEKVKASV